MGFFIDTALAQAANGQKSPSMIELLALPIGFLVIMYFLIIRPQQKKVKEHSSLLSSLKVGDEVVTSGGIIGKIRSIADTFITLEIATNTSIKVLKGNISTMTKVPEKK